MSKGDKQRGNREVKKAKKVKSAAATDTSKSKSLVNIADIKKK